MTDNEIIKALVNCTGLQTSTTCFGCPYSARAYATVSAGDVFCKDKMCRDALDLINRQKAEIERLNRIRAELSKEIDVLKTNNHSMCLTMPNMAKAERAEAIKEFAERLKENCYYPLLIDITPEIIDNLVKEMVGENEQIKEDKCNDNRAD